MKILREYGLFFENNVKLKAGGIGLGLFASSFNHIACNELK